MHILYYSWQENTTSDFLFSMQALGHQVSPCMHELSYYFSDGVKSDIRDQLQAQTYDAVFTFNFFPLVSDMAESLHIPYICWVFDCPHYTLYSNSIRHSCNYLFLFDRDMCLFSASCIMRSIQFEVTVEAEKDTDLWVIPSEIYQSIMEGSAPVSNYTNELMASRFSDVMWLMEQVMWKSLDKRVAAFLLEEVSIEGTSHLKITHETIANHLGSHREVITRMLRYFQNEGMVKLSRSSIEITNAKKLEELNGQ